MKRIPWLCFNAEGIINPDTLKQIEQDNTDSVILSHNGTTAGLEQLCRVKLGIFPESVTKIGIAKTPEYEVRAVGPEGNLTAPLYFLNEDVRDLWFCNTIIAEELEISIRERSRKSDTWAILPDDMSGSQAYLALRLWKLMEVIDKQLAFPAAVIERLIDHTYYLTKGSMDINHLRQKTGIEKLSYNSILGVVTLEVGGELYSVGLDVLNHAYGEIILPYYRSIKGRNRRLAIRAKNHADGVMPTEMSFGILGKLVSDRRCAYREKVIGDNHPISDEDLLLYAQEADNDVAVSFWSLREELAKQAINPQSRVG